jgi:hypothetical protein
LAKQAISLKTSFDAKLSLPEKRASWFLEGVLGEDEFAKFIEGRNLQIAPSVEHARLMKGICVLQENLMISLIAILWLWRNYDPSAEMPDWQ